jgi:transcriptional antiterminator RfaH
MEKWYALYTKPNAEHQVSHQMEAKGLCTYLPEIDTRRKKQPLRKKPFFPCYLFVKVNLQTTGISQLRWASGVRRVVSHGQQPIPVPAQVIDLIRRQLGDIEAQGGLPVHSFQPGDTVRITEGPFRDMVAIFEGPTTPQERVQVLLEMLGRLSRMEINASDLAPAPPEAEPPQLRKRPRRTRGGGRFIRGAAQI